MGREASSRVGQRRRSGLLRSDTIRWSSVGRIDLGARQISIDLDRVAVRRERRSCRSSRGFWDNEHVVCAFVSPGRLAGLLRARLARSVGTACVL
jgi:hypothetical protein